MNFPGPYASIGTLSCSNGLASDTNPRIPHSKQRDLLYWNVPLALFRGKICLRIGRNVFGMNRKSFSAAQLYMLTQCFPFSHKQAQYIAIDANFRCKNKDRGSTQTQSLTGCSGHFVNPEVFKSELERETKEPQAKEKSTCSSSFAAVERANSRLNRGFAVTGVVAAIDSRHGMLLPNSVADLQRGEK